LGYTTEDQPPIPTSPIPRDPNEINGRSQFLSMPEQPKSTFNTFADSLSHSSDLSDRVYHSLFGRGPAGYGWERAEELQNEMYGQYDYPEGGNW
jgi:hypothetical protein